MSDETNRSMTVTWTDPTVALPSLRELSGIEYLRRVKDGVLPPPPIASVFGWTFAEVEPGRVVGEIEPGEAFFNPLGSIHGGFACTMLDTVLACAGHTTLPAGSGYTSVDLNVRYLRAIQPASGVLRATGRVLKPGRRVVFTEGEIADADGRVYASATSTLLVLT